MATRQPVIDAIHTFVAAENLTAAQFHLVRISCWSDVYNSPLISLCGNGQKMCGILADVTPQWGVGAVVRVGKYPCVLHEALACSRSWASTALGHARGAVALDWVGGMAHEPGVLSPTPTGHEKGTLDLECLNPWHADAGFQE